jgi:hypothetical protein
MPRPAETNAERLRHPMDHTNMILTALGRVLPLLQGLGGYIHGCADAPPWRELHKFMELNPKALALESLSHVKQAQQRKGRATLV